MSSSSEPVVSLTKVVELSNKDEDKLTAYYKSQKPPEKLQYYAVAYVTRGGTVSSSVQVEKLEKPRGPLLRGYYITGGGGSELDVRKMVGLAISRYPILRVVLSVSNGAALDLYMSMGFTYTWHDSKVIDGDRKQLLTYETKKKKPAPRPKLTRESAAAKVSKYEEDDE